VFSADSDVPALRAAETAFWSWLRVGCRPEATLFPGLVLLVLVGHRGRGVAARCGAAAQPARAASARVRSSAAARRRRRGR
jgi:hypothetical protein